MSFIVQLLSLAFDELELEPAEVEEAEVHVSTPLGVSSVRIGTQVAFIRHYGGEQPWVCHVEQDA